MVRMTRRVAFSSGHRYWFADRTAEENRALFGRWASPYNHGHNYILEVTVEGAVDPVTGMIANIKQLDDALRAGVVGEFDQKSLNDEVAAFRDRAPSTENVLAYVVDRLSDPSALPAACRLTACRLEETPLLWANWHNSEMTLTRVYEFAASHRLHVPGLSETQNADLFGKCNNPAGHGHNYVLEVTVSGEPDPVTGMIADVDSLDEVVNREVIGRYDHKNLNEDLPDFRDRPTTTEVVTQEIFRRLDGKLPARLAKVKLWETARNAFEVAAE